MDSSFWKYSRKVGPSGFYGEVGEKLKKEVPQQAAQNRDKLKKKKEHAEKKAEEVPEPQK